MLLAKLGSLGFSNRQPGTRRTGPGEGQQSAFGDVFTVIKPSPTIACNTWLFMYPRVSNLILTSTV